MTATSDELSDNASIHADDCAVWRSPDPVDACDCGADEQPDSGGAE